MVWRRCRHFSCTLGGVGWGGVGTRQQSTWPLITHDVWHRLHLPLVVTDGAWRGTSCSREQLLGREYLWQRQRELTDCARYRKMWCRDHASAMLSSGWRLKITKWSIHTASASISIIFISCVIDCTIFIIPLDFFSHSLFSFSFIDIYIYIASTLHTLSCFFPPTTAADKFVVTCQIEKSSSFFISTIYSFTFLWLLKI